MSVEKQEELDNRLWSEVKNVNATGVRLALADGANASCERDSWTPLHWCGKVLLLIGLRKVAEALIEGGANVQAVTSDGQTPLHVAVDHLRYEVAELLVSRGANQEAKTESGRTPLSAAAGLRKGSDSMVELLVSHGADVHTTDENGSTPLHHAANMGNLKAAEILIEHGAVVNARDSDKKTPLYWSAKHEERGVDTGTFLRFGIEANFNHAGVSRMLREKGGVK